MVQKLYPNISIIAQLSTLPIYTGLYITFHSVLCPPSACRLALLLFKPFSSPVECKIQLSILRHRTRGGSQEPRSSGSLSLLQGDDCWCWQVYGWPPKHLFLWSGDTIRQWASESVQRLRLGRPTHYKLGRWFSNFFWMSERLQRRILTLWTIKRETCRSL